MTEQRERCGGKPGEPNVWSCRANRFEDCAHEHIENPSGYVLAVCPSCHDCAPDEWCEHGRGLCEGGGWLANDSSDRCHLHHQYFACVGDHHADGTPCSPQVPKADVCPTCDGSGGVVDECDRVDAPSATHIPCPDCSAPKPTNGGYKPDAVSPRPHGKASFTSQTTMEWLHQDGTHCRPIHPGGRVPVLFDAPLDAAFHEQRRQRGLERPEPEAPGVLTREHPQHWQVFTRQELEDSAKMMEAVAEDTQPHESIITLGHYRVALRTALAALDRAEKAEAALTDLTIRVKSAGCTNENALGLYCNQNYPDAQQRWCAFCSITWSRP